jgi:anti-anti-sigma regulatory factor
LDIATAPQLVGTLRQAHLQPRLVVLDPRELESIDSSGVHAIVNDELRARQAGRPPIGDINHVEPAAVALLQVADEELAL